MNTFQQFLKLNQMGWPAASFRCIPFRYQIENIIITDNLFADDVKFYSIISSNADNWVLFSLNRAVDWISFWKMIFNVIKCHHLHIGKNCTGTKYTMKSGGQQIELEKVKNEKNLRVIIDQNLTCRGHTTS